MKIYKEIEIKSSEIERRISLDLTYHHAAVHMESDGRKVHLADFYHQNRPDLQSILDHVECIPEMIRAVDAWRELEDADITVNEPGSFNEFNERMSELARKLSAK